PRPSAPQRRSRRLPHRAGITDQRRPSRASPGGRRAAACRQRLAHGRGARRRNDFARRRGCAERWERHRRDARTRGLGWWTPVGRSASGPRLRGTGGAAPRRPGMIRVLLADDQTLIRRGLRSLLDSEPDIEVIGEAGDGDEAVALARSQRPDVVLMDIRMPGTDGLAATRTISEDDELTAVPIIILTTFALDDYVFETL